MNFMCIYRVCMGMYICMYLHMYIHMYAHVCHNYIKSTCVQSTDLYYCTDNSCSSLQTTVLLPWQCPDGGALRPVQGPPVDVGNT